MVKHFPHRIGVLGPDGVTGKAVIAAVARLGKPYEIVEPSKADIVVASPGIPYHQYPEVNAEIVSEPEWAYRWIADKKPTATWVAISGTNGKTTATMMLAEVTGWPACGNMGEPLTQFVAKSKLPDGFVVELSSYQLHGLRYFHPKVGVLLNITPDHQAWHKMMRHYVGSKLKLFKQQTSADVAVLYKDDPELKKVIKDCGKAKKVRFSLKDADAVTDHPYLIGQHNRVNATAVYHAALALGLKRPAVLKKIQAFKGVSHRIELIRKYKGSQVYNDSKSTSPICTAVALEAMPRDVILIVGGQDKGLSLKPILESRKIDQVRHLIAYGKGGQRFIDELSSELELAPIAVRSFDSAVQQAHIMLRKDCDLLLSPGCASFDQFKNFEERGERFRTLVEQWQ